MSGWTKIEQGDIILIHHSTSSTIELQILDEETEGVVNSVWFDYYAWDDLLKAINEIQSLKNKNI